MADTASSQRLKLLNVTILLGICFLLLFWNLGVVPFFLRGESREGLVVSEMYATGNWILPAVNGDYIPFKPPLFHWFGVITGYPFGGIDEFTLRLPSAIFAALGVLMTYFTAGRLWGERAGMVAGTVLATTTEWWQAGTNTQVDMTLAFFIAAACLYFYFLYKQRDFGVAKSLGLPILMGLATLAKGPIGFLIPSLTIFVFLWLRHDLPFVKKLHPFASAAVFLLVAGSWYGLALWQGGPAFFFRQIIDENFRTAAGTYGRHQPIYYYFPVLLLNTLPWSVFFPAIALFIYHRRSQLADDQLLFPLIWFGCVFIFFTISLGKRGVYLLPLYPAVALIFGAWWNKLEEGQVQGSGLTCTITALLAFGCLLSFVIISLYFAANYGLASYRLVDPLTRSKNLSHSLRLLIPPSTLVAACFALYAAALFYLIWALLRKDWRAAFASVSSVAIAFTLLMRFVILPPVAYERTMKPFMARVAEKVHAHAPIFFYHGFDYGAVFYARRHIPLFTKKYADMKPPFFLLMWEEEWKRIEERPSLKMLDISEGRGLAGRHRLVLVERQPVATSSPELLPTDTKNYLPDKDAD
ncbi:MAG TPA: glycosyltransferase family 39 protein [Candidatus Binatia bacterium]